MVPSPTLKRWAFPMLKALQFVCSGCSLSRGATTPDDGATFARQGDARQVGAWRSEARRGTAGPGAARQFAAGHGGARQGRGGALWE